MSITTTKEASVELQLAEAVTAPTSEERTMSITLPAHTHATQGTIAAWAADIGFTEARREADRIAGAIYDLAVETPEGGRVAFDSIEDAQAAIVTLNSVADEKARDCAATRHTVTLTGDTARVLGRQFRSSTLPLLRHWKKEDRSDSVYFAAGIGGAFAEDYKVRGDTWSWLPDRRKPKSLTHYEFLGFMEFVSFDPDTATTVLMEAPDPEIDECLLAELRASGVLHQQERN